MCWIWRWCSYIWDIDGWRERGREQRMGSILKSRFIAIASYSWIYFVAYLTHQRIVWREPNVACSVCVMSGWLGNFLFEEQFVGLWISTRNSVCSGPELMLTRVPKQEKGMRRTVLYICYHRGCARAEAYIISSVQSSLQRFQNVLFWLQNECDVWIGPAMYQLRSSFFQRGQIVTTDRYSSTPRISRQEIARPLRPLLTGDHGIMEVAEQNLLAI